MTPTENPSMAASNNF